MEPEAEKILNHIRTKEIHELTQFDKDFLRARASYLGRNTRNKYQSVLDEKLQPREEQEEVTAVDPLAHPATQEDGDEE